MSTMKAPALTAEDYRLMPETGPRHQLIEGNLHMAPAPNRYHQDVTLNIFRLLDRYLEKHPLGRLYLAPFDVYLSRTNVYQPDVVFIAREHAWILTDAGAEGTPDFIVEILSPQTAHLDRKTKRRVYARYGVKELWLVDPDAPQIEQYYLQRDPRRPAALHGVKDSFASACFPGLKLSAARIFRR
jgi:Uma2 family endonuclease